MTTITPAFSDFIIMSDLDGTLIDHGNPVSSRNREALERFTVAGGKFGIATGRSLEWTKALTEELPVNFPCVLYNGGVLYDFAGQEYLMRLFLPENARALVEKIALRFPSTAILPVTEGEAFLEADEVQLVEYVKGMIGDYLPVNGWRESYVPWFKVLIALPGDLYDDFFKFTETLSEESDGMRLVATNQNLAELLPAHSSKGTALNKLVEMGLAKREQLVAVGDFYNDLEMIRYAGIGATLTDSPKDLQDIADVLVCPCAEGSLADLVEYLEKTYPAQ